MAALRSLFITTGTPYPSMGGAALRDWQNISLLRPHGPVGVFTITLGGAATAQLPDVERWQHCGPTAPVPWWEELQRRAWWLRPGAHPHADAFYTGAIERQLWEFLQTFQPELVVFEQIWLYRYLGTAKRFGCRVILDQHNVESALYQQVYGTTKLRLPRLRAVERHFVRNVDAVWTCSDTDADLLQKLYALKTRPAVVPNGIELDRYAAARTQRCPLPESLGPRRARDILFLGVYNYPPNAEAADILIREIYPPLQADYPESRLLLVGRKPTASMLAAAAANPNIIVTGGVPDVLPYFAAASVLVAPLFKGSGTRLKILEAFAAGCPIVTTSKGCEGLDVSDGEQLAIADTVDGLIAAVRQLWGTPGLSESLADAAYALVRAEYSREGIGPRIATALQGMSRLPAPLSAVSG